MFKRLSDIIISSISLMFLFPMFILIGVAIKLDSPGPIFHKGFRVGRLGIPFKMYKFRTMQYDPQSAGPTSTPLDDDRITNVGGWLRAINLDELPQFFNVLKGNMSIVGPRPQVQWAVDMYSEEERIILTIRPGITDLATIAIGNEGKILKGSENPDQDYLDRIWPVKRELQMKYLRDMSTLLDLKIIFLTIKVSLFDPLLQLIGISTTHPLYKD